MSLSLRVLTFEKEVMRIKRMMLKGCLKFLSRAQKKSRDTA